MLTSSLDSSSYEQRISKLNHSVRELAHEYKRQERLLSIFLDKYYGQLSYLFKKHKPESFISSSSPLEPSCSSPNPAFSHCGESENTAAPSSQRLSDLENYHHSSTPHLCRYYYRQLAKTLHPDKGGDEAAFNRATTAYHNQDLALLTALCGAYVPASKDDTIEDLKEHYQQLKEEEKHLKENLTTLMHSPAMTLRYKVIRAQVAGVDIISSISERIKEINQTVTAPLSPGIETKPSSKKIQNQTPKRRNSKKD